MKRLSWLLSLTFLPLLWTTQVWYADLQSLRGTVPTQDRAAFQSAMQSKMSTATADERAAMRQSKSGTASGTGNKYQKGKNR